jgi:hypothetical protein
MAFFEFCPAPCAGSAKGEGCEHGALNRIPQTKLLKLPVDECALKCCSDAGCLRFASHLFAPRKRILTYKKTNK